jgi:hypothetical protein
MGVKPAHRTRTYLENMCVLLFFNALYIYATWLDVVVAPYSKCVFRQPVYARAYCLCRMLHANFGEHPLHALR